jgi:putative ABC transport system permease protein
LLINDQVREFTVRGVYPDSNGNESAIVMDLAAAQRALNRFGRIDRILLKVPEVPSLEEWQQRVRSALPAGVEVRPQGTGTNENRRMLAAFRWNLRLLSYIALIVGAFLIYNTISVSVVRRRPETGIARALGASRGAVLVAFIGEAAFFGLAGAALGLPVGRGDRVERVVRVARIRHRRWRLYCFCILACPRSVARLSYRSHGAWQARVHRAYA